MLNEDKILIKNHTVATQPIMIHMVDNISAQPFRLVSPSFAYKIEEAVPSSFWQKTAKGEVDLALITVAKQSMVSSQMEPIGDFGVASDGAVKSVLFLSKASLSEILTKKIPVHLTADSETSRRLFIYLCQKQFGILPVTTTEIEQAGAVVCIGDDALHKARDKEQWQYQVDLPLWWKQSTGLSFVFARWMVRKSLPFDMKKAIETWLEDCVEAAQTPLGRERMIDQALSLALFDNRRQADEYFTLLISKFSSRELEGEAAFLRVVSA